jgi:hypothetical protein
MGDFLPGYVTTFANTNFNKKKANLVLVGFESGSVYGSFDTKEELLETISKKPYNNTKMCYYSPLINFTISDLNTLNNKKIFLVNDNQVMKIRQSAQQIFSLI